MWYFWSELIAGEGRSVLAIVVEVSNASDVSFTKVSTLLGEWRPESKVEYADPRHLDGDSR